MSQSNLALRSERPLDPNVLQRQASNPDHSVWVGASAGTGKTKVLTDRVLRLLLPREDGRPGTDPARILCLTFTKAGASEMALRISETLGHWAVLPDEELQDTLRQLLGRQASFDEQAAARQLFARTVDTPGGMKIMTVHSFCKSVLSRFPLEAGIAPGFTALEDSAANLLLEQARRAVMESGEAAQALHSVASVVNEEQFFALLQSIIGERYQFERLLRDHFGVEGIYADLCRMLNIPAGISGEDLLIQACSDDHFDKPGLLNCCKILGQSKTPTDQDNANMLQDWLSKNPQERAHDFEVYKSIFLTQKCEIKKKLVSKAVQEQHSFVADVLLREAERICALEDRVKAARSALLTRELLFLGQLILQHYQVLKNAQSALDFDDLILKTLRLVEERSSWVLYKLDQGLEHILIDEAQDTNPEQWKIIDALCSEFYAGASAHNELRTVFTVGDEKQSIYSFQRASPEEFFRMHGDFKAKITEAGAGWADVDLNISFRSVQSVLTAVDAVFQALGQSHVEHNSFRGGQAGLVELWPVFESQKEVKDESGWVMPDSIRSRKTGASQLCDHIAAQIRFWLDSKEVLPTRGRVIRPGDIMILVRTRNAFVHQLARALKNKNIPLSGVDRLILSQDIAVQDLLAMMEFALLPEDDLTLAGVLKSPFIGMREEDLFTLCHGRSGSLWVRVQQSSHKDIAGYLSKIVQSGRSSKPYDFLMMLLQKSCPADEVSGMRAIQKRLGADSKDPIEELLNAALSFERMEGGSLQQFVQYQRREEIEIKREHEEGGDHVRIMTVHGSKGLQAPIVILPDTLRATLGTHSDMRLLWPDKTTLDMPLWTPNKDFACDAFSEALESLKDRAEAEYRRLLYVAMTRAEDRLYIGGYQGKKEALEKSWYYYVLNGLQSLPDIETLEDGTLRLSNPQVKAPDRVERSLEITASEIQMPDWVRVTAPVEMSPPTPLSPSRPSEMEPMIVSPLKAQQQDRFLRGNLTHRLLEILPDLAPEKRKKAAQQFLAKNGQGVSQKVADSIIEEIFKILENPVFGKIFMPGSQAEVPLTGVLDDGRVMSGQIDRLLVTDDEILIVDYKTNRPPPKDPKAVPAIYYNQMNAYADIIARIYPGRAVQCALLWTDGPFLMPIVIGAAKVDSRKK